jgi:hypothetical protein
LLQNSNDGGEKNEVKPKGEKKNFNLGGRKLVGRRGKLWGRKKG